MVKLQNKVIYKLDNYIVWFLFICTFRDGNVLIKLGICRLIFMINLLSINDYQQEQNPLGIYNCQNMLSKLVNIHF